MLIGDGGNWTMLHNISSTRKLNLRFSRFQLTDRSEYLNYEDTKFSKSRNVGFVA